jgi:hypothetical protein
MTGTEQRDLMAGLPAAGIAEQQIRLRYPAGELIGPWLPAQPITNDVERVTLAAERLVAEDPTMRPAPGRHRIGNTLTVLFCLAIAIEFSFLLLGMWWFK